MSYQRRDTIDSFALQPMYPAPPPFHHSLSSTESPAAEDPDQPTSGPESYEKTEDWSVIYRFKTTQCFDPQCEKWSECWWYHSDVDRRRVPAYSDRKESFNYDQERCGEAARHTACEMAHNKYEVSFHPLLYRTQLCDGQKSAGVCYVSGLFCPNAHSYAELRFPGDLYPVAISEKSVHFSTTECSPPTTCKPLQRDQANEPHSPQSSNPEVTTVPVVSPSCEDLLSLYEVKGALENQLSHFRSLLKQRRAELTCAKCLTERRLFIFSTCGQGICYRCSQRNGNECPACGEKGTHILLRTS